MIRVIGVRFRTAGKVYYFDPLEYQIKRGDNVIVETARGIEFGTVVSDIREVSEESVVLPLKPVLRLATQRDKEQEIGNKEKEREAFRLCQEKIREHRLEMKLIDAEYTFDNNKVLFYFTADGRIDFRELVKDLASVFKTRIELRQIGVRDETKIMGGIGICGRPLCCHSYLSDFIPVSIKMAKEQNLSLNPTKISGVCGRLMCCLKNEEDTYEELNRRLPNIGDTVTTEDGQRGEVQSVNVLRQLVKVLIDVGDEKELKEYEVEQLRFRRHHSKRDRQNLSPEELAELERLEQEESTEESEGGSHREKENRPAKGNRQERGGREDREERKNRQEKRSREERGSRQENAGREERGSRQENAGREERGERRNRQDHGNRQKDQAEIKDRNPHQEKNNPGTKADRQRNDKHRHRGKGRQDKPKGNQEAAGSGAEG